MFCLKIYITKVPVLVLVVMVTSLFIQHTSSYTTDNRNRNHVREVQNHVRDRRQATDTAFKISNQTENQSSDLRQLNGISCGGVHVEIIVSPQIINLRHDYLVLYWETVTVLPGDKLVLYNQDPNRNNSIPLYDNAVDSNHGWVTTDFYEGRSSIVPEIYERNCLGYWVAYVRGDSGLIAASTCLSAEPRWMEESWFAISRLSLSSIFIPGTHNAAAYKSYVPERDHIFYKYTYCQEISILSQLLWGVRALDLRIAHYPESKDIWWCNHDFVKLRPLKEVIEDVKLFLNNTQEIIILDVHNFPVGFVNQPTKVHDQLLTYFENELSDYLAPSSLGWSATLDDVKRSGKKVILAYNSYYGSSEYKWPPIAQKWANKQNLKEFERFFGNIFDTQVMAPWAAMVELTPQAFDVLFDKLGGLRQMATVVNPTVTSHFHGEWGRTCHVVHCDFIRGTGIVKAAIKWNLKRAGYYNCNSINS